MILKRYESLSWHEGFNEPTGIRRWTLKGAREDGERTIRANLGLLGRWDVTVYPPRRLPPTDWDLRFARSLRGSIVDRRSGEVIEQWSILD